VKPCGKGTPSPTLLSNLHKSLIDYFLYLQCVAKNRSGLISLPKKEIKHLNLSKKLRGTISSSRAKEMIEALEEERAEWERRLK